METKVGWETGWDALYEALRSREGIKKARTGRAKGAGILQAAASMAATCIRNHRILGYSV